MRIAFDVKGTIDGPYQDKVLRLFMALEKNGHELTVWSSEFSLATRAVARHGLNAGFQSKVGKGECPTDEYFDLAIDDEAQTWLATNRLIMVHELPDDVEAFAEALTAPVTAIGGANV